MGCSAVSNIWELPVGFPGGSAGNKSASNAGVLGLIPGLGRSPGEGKGYPLQYSGLENSMDYIVHGVAKSQTRLSDFHFSLDSDHQVSEAVSSPVVKTRNVSRHCQISPVKQNNP